MSEETLPTEADIHWMRLALEEAKRAAFQEEVPIGAVLVREGEIVGRGYNLTERERDATAHAEMLALRQAHAATGALRLLDTTLYVTLEPCAMCAGAIVLARVPRLVFGAPDPQAGACGSLRNVVEDSRLNHRCAAVGGVLQEECADLIRRFFTGLRSVD